MLKISEGVKNLFYFALPSIFVGAIVGSYPGYKGFEYVWKSADFCTSCHVHDYATIGWQQSAHGGLTTCHDCHHQPLRAYLKETWIMVTNPPTFPQDLHHTPYIKPGLCEACHVAKDVDRSSITGPLSWSEVARIPKIDDTSLHQAHLQAKTDFVLENHIQIPEAQRNDNPTPNLEINRSRGEERDIGCADCHGGPMNRGHSFGAVDRSCVRCHESTHKGSNVMVEFGCRSCHFQDFLINGSSTNLKKKK